MSDVSPGTYVLNPDTVGSTDETPSIGDVLLIGAYVRRGPKTPQGRHRGLLVVGVAIK
jgi:hypothetical protein